jgi:hypothetical protein
MIVQETRCPRCAIRRTVRLGTWGLFCFNCRMRIEPECPAAPPRRLGCLWVPDYPFSPAELLRLEYFRAAVQAGFYSDWPRNVVS